MKTFFKVVGILILIILALLFILPIVYEGKIVELAKKEINKQVNAKIDFEDIDLSVFSNFPNFTLSIKKLTLIGTSEFENDTLASIGELSATIGLFDVIKGDKYSIKKLYINQPDFYIKVLKTGRTNYDIGKPSDVSTASSDETSGFELSLKKVLVENGSIRYIDEEQQLEAEIDGLNLQLAGNFTDEVTLVNLNISSKYLNVSKNQVNYLNKTRLRYKANIEADLKNEIYTLGRNELALNDLRIGFDGSISVLEEGINFVITFNAPGNNFKSILSLVPAIYAKNFESIDASGNVDINGYAKGIYSESRLPAFKMNMSVENGMFHYIDLPESVTNIQLQSSINNPGGDPDQTVLRVADLKLTLGENPIAASMQVKTPVSDPDIDMKVKGEIDFTTLKNYYPIDGESQLSGVFIADIQLKGKLSTLEKEQYEKFIAMGSLLVKDFKYESDLTSEPVFIPNAQLNFSPRYLDLVNLDAEIGRNNIKANGKVTNYLDYVFGDGVLEGKMTTSSSYFNLDEMTSKKEENLPQPNTDQQPAEESETSVLKVPENVSFILTSSFKQLVFDNLELNNVKGSIVIGDQRLTIRNLRSEFIGGTMSIDGYYDSKNEITPRYNLDFSMNNIDLPTSYQKFALVRKYMPLAKKTKGNFSTNLKLNGKLDNKMMPVYKTLNGAGQMTTSKLVINELNTLIELANALYFDELKTMELKETKLSFQFLNGKLITKPFDLKYQDITGRLEGWTGLDQQISYLMTLDIPRNRLGAEANQLMNELTKEAEKLGLDYKLPETIKVGIKIEGTLQNPKVKTDLKQQGNDLVKKAKEELEKQIRKEIQAQADKLLAEADKQAKALMDEAKKQVRYLNENADDAVAKLNSETDKQAQKLMSEAKKQGVLAELAAKEAIKQLRKEADKQINGLRSEANKQADEIVKIAKTQADQIKRNARKNADEILK